MPWALRVAVGRGDHANVPADSFTDSVRSRVAVVALCVVLSILILYRTGADIDDRRERVRGRRVPRPPRSRRRMDDAPEMRSCEVLASSYSPFATLRPGARLVWVASPPARLVPFVPTLGPHSQN
jgi:hypothetical protein